MILSNLPTMLQHQDFHARHADMLEAARGGVTVDREAVRHDLVMRECAKRFHESLAEGIAELQSQMADDVFRSGSQWAEGWLGPSGISLRKITEYRPGADEIQDTIVVTIVEKPENVPYVYSKSQWLDLFAQPNAKLGSTLRIRLPSDFGVTDGPSLCSASTTPQPSSQG